MRLDAMQSLRPLYVTGLREYPSLLRLTLSLSQTTHLSRPKPRGKHRHRSERHLCRLSTCLL